MIKKNNRPESQKIDRRIKRNIFTQVRREFRFSIHICLLTVLLASLKSLPVQAQESEDESISGLLESEHELSLAFETPHTKWAKPYAGGKVRILFFTGQYQGSTYTREIIELLQRFDLDADAVYVRIHQHRLLGDGNPRWYADTQAGTKRALRLLEKIHDVYFFNQASLNDLPEIVQKKIRERIRQGAGLVMIGTQDSTLFSSQQKLNPRPSFTTVGDCYLIGQGRAVLIPTYEKLTYKVGWETDFDYKMEKQGRAILWAADKVPEINFSVQPDSINLAGENLSNTPLMVSWQNNRPATKIEIRLCRWDGRKIPLLKSDGSAGAVQISLPQVRAGNYHLDIFAVSPEGIESWMTVPVTVTEVDLVKSVALKREWAEIGEDITGNVHLNIQSQTPYKIRIQLADCRGRILVRKEIENDDNQPLPFRFKVEPWMPMLLRVEAVILDRTEREVSSAYTFCRITKRHRDRFNFVVWNYPGGDLAPYGVESMAQNGTTAILQGGEPPYFLSASDMAYIPYATSIRLSSHSVTGMLDSTGVLKNGCYHDEAKVQHRVDEAVRRQQKSREHGVLAYSLGDENAVRMSCLSPYCLRAYQDYLKGTYRDIGRLNASWGSAFKHFDEVTLSEGKALPAADAPDWFKFYFAERLKKHRTDNEVDSEKQIILGDKNDEMLALQAENYPRWYDRQAFQCETYVELCKRYKQSFQKLDPKALTGFEGTDSFTMRKLTTRSRQGGDLDAFIRELDYFGPYPGPANEVVRSLAPAGFPCGNWLGYSMDADRLLYKYWDQITNRMNTVQWWRWDCLDGYHGFLSPNFSPFPATKELLEDTRIVRDGLGTLLMHYDMFDDGIAMLYSMPSTHIAHFDGNPSYGNYKRDNELWYRLLHDAGLQFNYVSDRMLRLGEFDGKRYKILILPLSFAIGEKEAEVIREYVRNGGTILADVRPGLYDGHCKSLDQGIIDDVFGIRREGKYKAIPIDRLNISGEMNGQQLHMRWGNWYGKEIYPQMKIDPTVSLTTGKELGKAFHVHFVWDLNTPVCIVNEFGKGRAILLNFAIYNAPAGKLIKEILAATGINPVIRLKKNDDFVTGGIETSRWHNGKYELMALFGDDDGEIMVRLPESKTVYDLKQHKSYGQVRQFATTLKANRAAFFALLPDQGVKPVLHFTSNTITRGTVAKAALTMPGAAGKHAVRIRVTDPSGQEAGWFNQVHILDGREKEIFLPFAWNDQRGEWTVHAIDLFTDQPATVRLKVE